MNREQKRTFVKNAMKKGIKESDAKVYAEIIGNGSGGGTPPQDISEGEQIRLNTVAIKSRKNYENTTDKYKEFIDNNSDMVFTAHVEHRNLISLKEEPCWLFWSGDLIKVNSEGGNANE